MFDEISEEEKDGERKWPGMRYWNVWVTNCVPCGLWVEIPTRECSAQGTSYSNTICSDKHIIPVRLAWIPKLTHLPRGLYSPDNAQIGQQPSGEQAQGQSPVDLRRGIDSICMLQCVSVKEISSRAALRAFVGNQGSGRVQVSVVLNHLQSDNPKNSYRLLSCNYFR